MTESKISPCVLCVIPCEDSLLDYFRWSKCRGARETRVILSMEYEGDPSNKFTLALALLFHQIYSSNWAHLKALSILLKWGYSSLISNKK